MPSSSDACSSVKPAKYRSRTNSARRGSAAPCFGDGVDVAQFDPFPPAATTGTALAAGVVDQDAAHGLGSRGKKVSAPVPGS
jgi:hypothetical protein